MLTSPCSNTAWTALYFSCLPCCHRSRKLRFPCHVARCQCGVRLLLVFLFLGAWVVFNSIASFVCALGNQGLSCAYAYTCRVWDLVSGQSISTLHGHTAVVTGVAINPDGATIASGSEDMTVRCGSHSGHLGITNFCVQTLEDTCR